MIIGDIFFDDPYQRIMYGSDPYGIIKIQTVMIGFKTDAGIVEYIVDSVVENIGINDMQQRIIELMRSNPRITAKLMAEAIGIAPRNVQVHIQSLKKVGLVERIGPAKGGHWAVKQPGN